MTTNQINYQNAMERIRNDRAIEEENQRHNRAMESESTYSNREVNRHNRIMEQLQQKANEISAWKAAIDARYNELNIELGNRRAAEEERRNRQNELLTAHSQELQEWLNNKNVEIAARKAEWAHGEALLDLGIKQQQANTTQQHYEYSDYTQRINTVGGLGVSAVQTLFGSAATLMRAGVG